MIIPGRITDPDGTLRCGLFQQAGRNPQRSRSARRLHRRQARATGSIAKYQRLHRSVERRLAGRAEIAFAGLRLENLPFRLLDDIQHRSLAIDSAIDADAQINLIRARVLVVLGNQAKNGIRRTRVQGLKQLRASAPRQNTNQLR